MFSIDMLNNIFNTHEAFIYNFITLHVGSTHLGIPYYKPYNIVINK